MCRSILLLALALLSPTAVRGQSAMPYTLQGRVVDAETGAPLHGANVFLAHTMRGTATDSTGAFMLPDVLPGTYELVASMIGYAVETHALLADEPPDAVAFALEPVVYESEGILVTGERPRRWERQLETFLELFLGTSANTERCELLNPFVLDFEEEGGRFRAFASAPLLIENRALGYRMSVVLQTFETRDRHRQLWARFLPLYEPLTPRDEREARRWAKAREDAYEGSLRHFFETLVRGRAGRAGFDVRETPGLLLPQQRDDWAHLSSIPDALLVEPDASVGGYRVYFNAYLLVTYRKDREPRAYARFMAEQTGVDYQPQPVQHSILEFAFPAYVRADGHLLNPGALVTYGYWFWERLSERLPYEYTPGG